MASRLGVDLWVLELAGPALLRRPTRYTRWVRVRGFLEYVWRWHGLPREEGLSSMEFEAGFTRAEWLEVERLAAQEECEEEAWDRRAREQLERLREAEALGEGTAA